MVWVFGGNCVISAGLEQQTESMDATPVIGHEKLVLGLVVVGPIRWQCI
jgi:hypothetical protein